MRTTMTAAMMALWMTLAVAATSADIARIEGLFSRYGKRDVAGAILKARSGLITVAVGQELRTMTGRPNMEYITPTSVAADLGHLGISVQTLEQRIAQYRETKKPPKTRFTPARPMPQPVEPPRQPVRTASKARPSQRVPALCKKQWPNDFRMQNHCGKEQQKGLQGFVRFAQERGLATSSQPAFDEIDRAVKAGLTVNNPMAIIMATCTVKWSNPDVNWRMIDYCLRQQYDAYRAQR